MAWAFALTPPPSARAIDRDERAAAESVPSIASLRQQIQMHRARGDFSAAIPVAEHMVALCAVEENDSPFDLDDARRTLMTLQQFACLSAMDRCELRRANADVEDARGSAERLSHNVDVRRNILGPFHVETLAAQVRLAGWLAESGRLSEAELAYRQAMDAYRCTLGENHPATLRVLGRLAILAHYQGNDAESVRQFRLVAALRRRMQGPNHIATRSAEVNLAGILHEIGRYPESESLYTELLDWFGQRLGEDHYITLSCMGSLAATLSAGGKHDAAEQLLRRRLGITRRHDGSESNDIDGLHTLAQVRQAKGDPAGAEETVRDALKAHARIKGVHDLKYIQLLNLLAEVLHAQGRYDDAETTWTTSAESFELVRSQISYSGFERMRFCAEASPYLRASVCLARNGKPNEAWRYLERGLARCLIDTVDLASDRVDRSMTHDERVLRRGLSAALNEAEERVAALECVADTDRKLLHNARRNRSERRTEWIAHNVALADKYGIPDSEPYALGRIQAQIPRGTAVIAWLDFPSAPGAIDARGDHWACVLHHRGAPVWTRLSDSPTLGSWSNEDASLADRVARRLAGRPTTRTGLNRDLQRLYEQRLRPLEPHLRDVRRLIILPNGPMARVPVQALTHRYTISYAPSATVFAWLSETAHAAPTVKDHASLLALGAPSNSTRQDSQTSPIPGTGLEVRSIARLFRHPESRTQHDAYSIDDGESREPMLLLNKDATEDNLQQLAVADQLRRFSFIHLATHGVLNDLAPWRSALLLSPPESRHASGSDAHHRRVHDDRLTAEQIVRTWRLNAELVTLSGCETALGRVEGGEGFVGFSQALFASGARSLVLSLWKVDDQATALLMRRFYENLTGVHFGSRVVAEIEYTRGSPMPKTEALCEAQRWLQASSPHENRESLRAMGFDAAELEPAMAAARGGIRMTGEPSHRAYDFSDPHYWAAFVLSGDPD